MEEPLLWLVGGLFNRQNSESFIFQSTVYETNVKWVLKEIQGKKKYAHLILENNIYMQEMKTKSSVINFNVPFF